MVIVVIQGLDCFQDYLGPLRTGEHFLFLFQGCQGGDWINAKTQGGDNPIRVITEFYHQGQEAI
jgi:hypothetical protein